MTDFPVTLEDILVWALEYSGLEQDYALYLADSPAQNSVRAVEDVYAWLMFVAADTQCRSCFGYQRIRNQERNQGSLFLVSVAGVPVMKVDMRDLLSMITGRKLPAGAEGTTR